MSWACDPTGAYGRGSAKSRQNADEIRAVCNALGWCLESICALLGNIEHESGYNPWRWQGDTVLPVGDPRIGTIGGGNTAHAYGLCQQDPAAKYIYRAYAQMQNGFGPNYSDQAGSQYDGYAQLQYLHWICSQNEAGGEWLPNSSYAQGLGVPFEDFIVNSPNYTTGQLARVFFGCYERGTWSDTRVTATNYWYTIFTGSDPDDPDVPPGTDSQAAWIAVFQLIAKRKKEIYIYKKRKGGGLFR